MKKLKKLTVGDINAFNRYRRDEFKKAIISITRDLYGDKIPNGEVDRINALIQKVPGIDGDPNLTVPEIQFLIYRSLLKSYPDMTYEDAGNEMPMDMSDNMLDGILPMEEKVLKSPKKKTDRKKKPRDN